MQCLQHVVGALSPINNQNARYSINTSRDKGSAVQVLLNLEVHFYPFLHHTTTFIRTSEGCNFVELGLIALVFIAATANIHSNIKWVRAQPR
jgi:hypothetical protein